MFFISVFIHTIRVLIHNIYIFIKYITFHFLKAKLDINDQISSDKKQLIFKGNWLARCIAAIRNDILIKTFRPNKRLEAQKRDPCGFFYHCENTAATDRAERKESNDASVNRSSERCRGMSRGPARFVRSPRWMKRLAVRWREVLSGLTAARFGRGQN